MLGFLGRKFLGLKVDGKMSPIVILITSQGYYNCYTSNSSFIIQTMVRKMFVLYKRNVVGNTKNNTLHGGCLISLNINCSRDWANGSQEKSSKQCICAQHINLNEVLLQWKKKADKRTEKKGSEKRCYTAGNGKRNKSVTEERVPDSIVVSYDAEKVAKLDWGGSCFILFLYSGLFY